MGNLGDFLKNAREARGIDLHEAAQQTRININYLRGMESEDFSKLPGAVFVRGFLKSYAKFLRLDEEEVIKRYQELQPQAASATGAADHRAETKKPALPSEGQKAFPLEPLAWGASICVAMIALLFIAVKEHPRSAAVHPAPHASAEQGTESSAASNAATPVKLYLEIIAQEDVWILVRTDVSPQKKAVLKKGESVIWSADERFLLSYSNAGAVRLLLNGNELAVKASKSSVVRDLVITAGGIIEQKLTSEQPVRKPKTTPPAQPQPTATEPAETRPAAPQQETAAPAPSTAPASPALPFMQPQ